MCTNVTSTRSKVKVKVTELPKLRKVHFSRSISSAILSWNSKLMVGGHSMGPGLQLVAARFLNFHLGKLSREFKLRPISKFDEIQMAIFSVVRDATVTWLNKQVVLHVLCMLT